MKKDLAAVGSISVLLTAAIAWPVLRSPQTQIFGNEITGRHADPFTVMQQFATGQVAGAFWQPVTDAFGTLLARIVGPIPAYNLVILLSFPLTAVATYALARRIHLDKFGSALAAFAFTFAPVHLAQAVYHPHIAQTQWLPLYFLALIACIEQPTVLTALLLAASVAALALSNFYAGLIGGVVTLVALPAWWWARAPRPLSIDRRLLVPVATLSALVVAGLAYVWLVAAPVWQAPRDFAVPADDLLRYGARGWSYLIPSVEHPLFGGIARRFWEGTDVGPGLLEQQVSISWALIVLAVIGGGGALARRGALSRQSMFALTAITAWAWFCSLAPHTQFGHLVFDRPAAILYSYLPMFRSYARFGIVVALTAALLAGAGASWLVATRARAARWVLCALMAFAFLDSVPLTWRARDVLPTSAHRWVAADTRARTLDCTTPSAAQALLPWLMHDRLMLRGDPLNDCTDPNVATTMAALGFTHMIVRGTPARPIARQVASLPGLLLIRSAEDAQLFAVTQPKPIVATIEAQGFHAREGEGDDVWQWMGQSGWWRVINTADHPVSAQVQVDLASFPGPRHLSVTLDNHAIERILEVGPARSTQTIGPLMLSPGEHLLWFRSVESALAPEASIHNGDTRLISLRFGKSQWHVLSS